MLHRGNTGTSAGVRLRPFDLGGNRQAVVAKRCPYHRWLHCLTGTVHVV